VTVVEWKHIFGLVFDENGSVSLERECAIFEKVQKLIKDRFPLFQMKVIASGLKVLGKPHVQQQIDIFFESKKYTDMIVGYDMVNEEDFTPPLTEFLPQLYAAKEKAASMGMEFPLYLHSGETNMKDHQ